jgi:hypothetical protein
MAFATFGNGAPTTTSSGGGTTDRKKIAQRITFPNIEGRDAPGKTGNLAKPALITSLSLHLTSSLPCQVASAVWDSSGLNPQYSINYTPVSGIDKVSLSRSVFAGTNYLVGFALTADTPSATFTFGNVNTGVRAKFDSTLLGAPVSTSQFFSSAGNAALGSMNFELEYDVLPTEPINLTAEILTPSNPKVELNWDAPVSDGGRPVFYYIIQSSLDNVTWTTLRKVNFGETYTTAELAFGFTYYFRVAAINGVAVAAGSDYSGPFSGTASANLTGIAGNAQSFLTATVDNPEPEPLTFTDFGPGIRFTQIDVQYGAEYLYNEIQATTQDSFAELQTTEAPQSKALYGVRTYSLNNLLNSTDLGAFEVAKDYLTYYYQPELRVQSITVDLSNLTIEEKLQVLALEIDSFISVSFTPNGIGDPKIASGLVTGIAHRISITTHEVELRLRNERTLFTTDSDSKGILNVNILGP